MKYLFTLAIITLLITPATKLKAQSCSAGTIYVSDDSICMWESIDFHLIGSSGNIQWQSADSTYNFSDIPVAIDSTYKPDYILKTTYYRAVVTNGSCSDTSDTLQVFVQTPLYATFTNYRMGKKVTFSSDQSKGDIVKYLWDFGDGRSQSAEANPVHEYFQDSIYNVCLTLYDKFDCSWTICRNVEVSGIENWPQFPCSVYFEIYKDPTPHAWNLFYLASGVPTLTYDCNWGDGTTNSGSTLSHTYSTAGKYKICLTVHDGNSMCSDTYCDSTEYLAANDKINMLLSSVHTPFIKSQMAVYPNPCFNCEIKGIENTQNIVVVDILGRIVNPSFTKIQGGYQINFPGNLSGIFFVKNTKTGEVIKLIKE